MNRVRLFWNEGVLLISPDVGAEGSVLRALRHRFWIHEPRRGIRLAWPGENC
jgi:hypothetical protein